MRRFTSIAAAAFALAATAWVAPVGANSPATVDQIVCANDLIVEATVTAVRGTCEKGASSTRCTGAETALLLDLHIGRVLARKDTTTTSSSANVIAGASLNDVYVSGIEQFNGSGLDARTLPFVAATRHSGVPERRWTETAATSDDAARVGDATLKGGTFVFAFPLRRPARNGWFAMMWKVDREGDLLDLLNRTRWPGCPTIVE